MRRAGDSMVEHVKAIVEMSQAGAVAFEYGNNLRQQAFDGGFKEAFSIPGFVQRYIRPMFSEGRGPFRWTSLMGDPEDIYKIDEVVKQTFHANLGLVSWIEKARAQVKFQGLPARVWSWRYGERAQRGR